MAEQMQLPSGVASYELGQETRCTDCTAANHWLGQEVTKQRQIQEFSLLSLSPLPPLSP